jgi:hypothetical protein
MDVELTREGIGHGHNIGCGERCVWLLSICFLSFFFFVFCAVQ